MGNYNPSAPIILGEEWVPIREENLAFNEQVNNLEMGHSFTLSSPTQLSQGRFYVNKPPSSGMDNQAYTMAVYPKGLEDKSGPIHSVIIPCNAVGATGLPVQTGTLDNVTRLSNPSADPDLGIIIQIGFLTDVSIWFATNQYANLLANKRILGVNFLSNFRIPHTAGATFSNTGTQLNGLFLQLRNDSNTNRWNFPTYADDLFVARTNNPRVDRIGDVDRFFGGSVAYGQVDSMPITYSGMLTKFEATSGAQRINMHFKSLASAIPGPFVYINYAALEVFYCEENRVAVGTHVYNPWNQSPFLTNSPVMLGIPQQTNPIIMRDLAGNANPILPAGDYVVTVCEANLGDDLEVSLNAGPHAELNALRELYQIPRLQGRAINIPFPLDSGATSTPHTFTAEDTHVLPQISLHVSGGTPFPEVHVYGRQAIGQVYGSITVTQDILDSVAGGNFIYPWVRFYARRFGETTVPLTLSSLSPTVSGSGYSVSITPAQWDALPEILDRWKEVSLRFPDATPPVMGAGFTPQWRWSATGEHKGSRWEVLGCVAPALSGLPGNLLNLAVPPASQLGSATYGQPSAGTTVNMGWIPQYGPYVSATVDDTTADAVLIFSQDPAPVSGFSISTLSQALSGIGQDCGLNPMGIPTSLGYNRLTWTSPSSTGFATELQRMDTVDNTWETIMLSSTTSVSGFNDYEARVGILSSYRIRRLNTYGFYGPWSSTLTATITAPGVAVGVTGGHVLIFTTNSRQNGSSNLAYLPIWDSSDTITEDFTFPEAGFLTLQAMYNKDFFTAFRPLERGGERFQRNILVQAAAISPETLADFTSLRNMAWDTVPYICVRDEDGNRWFASINVPSGRVQRGRRLYEAVVDIIEVSDTPSQVDP
jgi:hypothetical protein